MLLLGCGDKILTLYVLYGNMLILNITHQQTVVNGTFRAFLTSLQLSG